MKNYNEGLIKACSILTEAWQDYFDDEVISKNEFKPINAFYNSLMDKFNKELMKENVPVEMQVTEVDPQAISNSGQWVRCPKCDGQGIVSKPPWIAGDQNTWTDTQLTYTCNLCKGMMVIKQRNSV